MIPLSMTPQELRPDEDFARYVAGQPSVTRQSDAEDIAGVIARKHCAGRKGRVDGAGIVESLDGEPGRNDDPSCAVGWLLSSLAPHECALLITRCGVSPRSLARHVRARPVRNDGLVRFLNQFAVPPDRAG